MTVRTWKVEIHALCVTAPCPYDAVISGSKTLTFVMNVRNNNRIMRIRSAGLQ